MNPLPRSRGNSYRNIEEISGWKAHADTRKFNWIFLTITDVFLDQKRVNVCEHMVKMVSHESFGKVPPDLVLDEKGEGMEEKLNGNHLRLIPGLCLEDNELICEFKMAAVMWLLLGIGYGVHVHSNRNSVLQYFSFYVVIITVCFKHNYKRMKINRYVKKGMEPSWEDWLT